MLNKVFIIGRLGKDPELKYTREGVAITTLSVATDESYTNRDGKKVEKTEWHSIITFQRLAENCSNFLSKGSLVHIEGSLQTRKWQDQQGQDRYSTEIKAVKVNFLDKREENRSTAQSTINQNRSSQENYFSPSFAQEQSGMDDTPF